MKLYKIHDWDKLYENNRSRTVKDLSWVAMPNKHDGENYTLIMAHEQGSQIFAAFVLMVEVASKCTPRGTLIRSNGIPHDVRSLSVKCRCPIVWFEIAFSYLEKNTDWLDVTDVAVGCQQGASVLTSPCQAGAQGGREGIERRGGNGAPHVSKEVASATTFKMLSILSRRYQRPDGQKWPDDEEHILAAIAREPDAIKTLKTVLDYFDQVPKAPKREHDFRVPGSISQLLRNWSKYVDEARNYEPPSMLHP